jgi:hypothetical protein
LPGRAIDVVADAAYHSRTLRTLPAAVSWTCRLARTSVLYDLAPPPTGKRGRPRLKGDRLGTPAELVATATWTDHQLHLYDETRNVQVTAVTCLWYGCFHTRTVRLVMTRELTADGTVKRFLALVTTDLTTPPEQIVVRYAARWAIAVTFAESRQQLGTGQARNRTQQAVERTVPLELLVYSVVVLWYARTGHSPQVVEQRRADCPWYEQKTTPAFEDMLTTLRKTIIAARFLPTRPDLPEPEENRAVQLAWAQAAA